MSENTLLSISLSIHRIGVSVQQQPGPYIYSLTAPAPTTSAPVVVTAPAPMTVAPVVVVSAVGQATTGERQRRKLAVLVLAGSKKKPITNGAPWNVNNLGG